MKVIKDTSDIITWIIGGLATLGLFNYKSRITSDNEKFKNLFDGQRVTEAKVAVVEAELKGIHAHFIQTLEDIKSQNLEMAKDVTEIKVGLAGIPKRHSDE